MTKNTASGWTWIIKLESDKYTGLLKLACKLGLHTSCINVSMCLYHNNFLDGVINTPAYYSTICFVRLSMGKKTQKALKSTEDLLKFTF
jgi:hypothetical protein